MHSHGSLSRLLAAIALTLALAGCGSKITQDNFAKIHEGMTKDQVIDLLGKPSNSSSMHVLGLSGSSDTWSGKHARIVVHFVDGKVRLKSFEQEKEDN